MLRPRLIPSLLLDGSGFYKTRKFKNPKYLGDPINIVKIFNEKEVDELLVLNISDNSKLHTHNFDLIASLSSESTAPLTYGGNISSFKEVEELFQLGIEKVCIKNIAFRDPTIVSKIAEKYGSQAIMVSLDVYKNIFGNYSAFSRVVDKRVNIGEQLNDLISRGAGEILLNAVHREGTLSGPDVQLIKRFSNIKIPLIYNGGVGSLSDVKMALESGADSVSAGSWFVYHGALRGVLISYPPLIERIKFFK